MTLNDPDASNEGLLWGYESVEQKLGRDFASDSDMDVKWPITLGRGSLAFHGEVDRFVPSDFSGVFGDEGLNVGRLDPLLWFPVDALLIDGVRDIFKFLSGEELPNRPEMRPPWGEVLWFGSVRLCASSSSSTKTNSEASLCETGVRGLTGVRRRE